MSYSRTLKRGNPYLALVNKKNLTPKKIATMRPSEWPTEEDDIGVGVPKPMVMLRGLPADQVDDLSSPSKHRYSSPTNIALPAKNLFPRTRITAKVLKREKKQHRKELIEKSKTQWHTKRPQTMDREHVDMLRRAIAVFFRSGYERYIKGGERATDEEINEYVSHLLKKYKAGITGGFVMKNMGLFQEGATKPSIDMDIFHSYESPIIDRNFYNEMARLFNADGEDNNWNVRIMPAFQGSNFQKQKLNCVRKYSRTIDGEYAEMDLCRAERGTTHEWIMRNFDMSICMNWYDGHQIFSMDKLAILEPALHTGWINYVYAHCIWDDLTPKQRKGCKRSYVRILKYLLRGYRLSCVDLRTGNIHEFVTSEFPNEIREMSPRMREKYYRAHPAERPANIPGINLNGNIHANPIANA